MLIDKDTENLRSFQIDFINKFETEKLITFQLPRRSRTIKIEKDGDSLVIIKDEKKLSLWINDERRI